MSLRLIIFLCVALTLGVLALPLMRRRVPPNRFYGVRLPKTMAHEEVWYEVNARSGFDLLLVAFALAATAYAAESILRIAPPFGSVVVLAVLSAGAVAVMVRAGRHADRIQVEEREAVGAVAEGEDEETAAIYSHPAVAGAGGLEGMLARWCVVLSLVFLWFGSSIAFRGMPSRHPVPFDESGDPSLWVDTTLRSWMGLPVLAAITTALLVGGGRRLRRRSSRLAPRVQSEGTAGSSMDPERVGILMENLLLWLTVILVTSIGAAQLRIWYHAHGLAAPAFVPGDLSLLPVILILLIVLFVFRIVRASVNPEESGTSGGDAGG